MDLLEMKVFARNAESEWLSLKVSGYILSSLFFLKTDRCQKGHFIPRTRKFYLVSDLASGVEGGGG